MAGRNMPWGGWGIDDFNRNVRSSIEEIEVAAESINEATDKINKLSKILLPLNTVTVAPSGGDFTTIRDAFDFITDASSNKRYVVIVSGAITETPQQILPPNYVDVILEPDTTITLTNTTDDFAIYFNGNYDSRWKARIPHTSKILRTGTFLNSRMGCVQIANGNFNNKLFFDGIDFESYVSSDNTVAARSVPVLASYTVFRNCDFFANSLVGNLIQRCYAFQAAQSGNILIGCNGVSGSASTISTGFTIGGDSGGNHVLINCTGTGGQSNEAPGIWFYSYTSSENSSNILFNSTGYAGVGNIAHGISVHKSSNARIFNCYGYSNPDGIGSGIFTWGQPDNKAHNVWVNCVGIGRGTSSVSHGLHIFACARDKFINCTFIGSPHYTSSCGGFFDTHKDGINDKRKLTFIDCKFFGGQSDVSLQNRSTLLSNCHAINLRRTNLVAGTDVQFIDFVDCKFISNEVSSPIYVDELYISGVRFAGGYASSDDSTVNKAIETNASSWTDAQIFNMILSGGLNSNITPATVTLSASNVIL